MNVNASYYIAALIAVIKTIQDLAVDNIKRVIIRENSDYVDENTRIYIISMTFKKLKQHGILSNKLWRWKGIRIKVYKKPVNNLQAFLWIKKMLIQFSVSFLKIFSSVFSHIKSHETASIIGFASYF